MQLMEPKNSVYGCLDGSISSASRIYWCWQVWFYRQSDWYQKPIKGSYGISVNKTVFI